MQSRMDNSKKNDICSLPHRPFNNSPEKERHYHIRPRPYFQIIINNTRMIRSISSFGHPYRVLFVLVAARRNRGFVKDTDEPSLLLSALSL